MRCKSCYETKLMGYDIKVGSMRRVSSGKKGVRKYKCRKCSYTFKVV